MARLFFLIAVLRLLASCGAPAGALTPTPPAAAMQEARQRPPQVTPAQIQGSGRVDHGSAGPGQRRGEADVVTADRGPTRLLHDRAP